MSKRLVCGGIAVAMMFGVILLWPSSVGARSNQVSRDLGSDRTLNAAAMAAASDVTRLGESDPAWAGLRIVDTGVEVSVVGRETAQLRAAISAGSKSGTAMLKQLGSGARTVPIVARPVARTMTQLQATTAAIDRAQWKFTARGITLKSWGPDVASNSVVVRLAHYSPEAADAVRDAFGPGVTVSPVSQQITGSG